MINLREYLGFGYIGEENKITDVVSLICPRWRAKKLWVRMKKMGVKGKILRVGSCRAGQGKV